MTVCAESSRSKTIAQAAESFAALVDATAPAIHADGLLAGPAALNYRDAEKKLGRWPWAGDDNLHFPMNVGNLFQLGLAGIEDAARRGAGRLSDDSAAYLEAIAGTYGAARRFVRAHVAAAAATGSDARLRRIANCCRHIAEHPPATFHDAVQLFWFAYVLRGRGTIGRLDQHLYPFYRADAGTGLISRDEAFAILFDLWTLINTAGSGDTLANLMISGQDRDGNDATNDVSFLIMDVTRAHKGTDPHINARVHSRSPKAYLDALAGLHLDGRGKGTVYNDDVIVPALTKVGVPIASARNYANDGCSEIVIDGESTIRMIEVDALKSLELALFNGRQNTPPGSPAGRYWNRNTDARVVGTNLHIGYESGDFTGMATFEDFFEAYWRQYRHQLEHAISGYGNWIANSLDNGVSSTFLAGTFPKVLETGKDLEQVAIQANMVFSGSIPTAADCLAAVKKVVFEERGCTPALLLDALKADFDGHEALRLRLLAAPKFGNDITEVDEIAAEIARRYCACIKSAPVRGAKCLWPCLFYHSFNDGAKIVCATPDGRRWRDPVGEHYGPVPGRARRGPTAVIRSVTRAPLSEAAGTATFNLSLSRSVVPRNSAGVETLRHLTSTATSLGIAVMNVAVYDVAELKEAKLHPERYADLQVRVWGYSARFIDLDDDMQDHVIARAVREESRP